VLWSQKGWSYLRSPAGWTTLPFTITNYMEENPSWELNSCVSSKKIAIILWKLKVHYHVHRSPTWARWMRVTPSHCVSVISISVFPHLCLDLPRGLFTSGSGAVTLHTFLLCSICAACCHLSYLPRFYHPNNCTWWRVQIMNVSIMQFSQSSCHLAREPKCSSQHPVLNHPHAVFCLC
jgi:hypothetical protein